jgi:hypothetical protein
MTTASNFITNCINRSTIIVESSGPLTIPLASLLTTIQEGINDHLSSINPRQTTSPEHIQLRQIIHQNRDITNIHTFDNSMFQGIALLKQHNTLDTRRFTLACINFFITPATYTAHTTTELLCYAYHITKNPLLINSLCPNGNIQLDHNYYPDLVTLQNVHQPLLATPQ